MWIYAGHNTAWQSWAFLFKIIVFFFRYQWLLGHFKNPVNIHVFTIFFFFFSIGYSLPWSSHHIFHISQKCYQQNVWRRGLWYWGVVVQNYLLKSTFTNWIFLWDCRLPGRIASDWVKYANFTRKHPKAKYGSILFTTMVTSRINLYNSGLPTADVNPKKNGHRSNI